MNKFFTALVISACLIVISSSAVFSDDITITTYFPSPYGSYLKLTSDQIAIGADYRTSAIPANGLIVEGQVGIGTTSAGSYTRSGVSIQTELDVAGEIAANDIYVKDKGKWLSGVSWCMVRNYGPNTGSTLCGDAISPGTSYAWYQAITGSGATTVPGTVIPGGTTTCGDTCPDATCPDSTTGGYDIPTSGQFLCCS